MTTSKRHRRTVFLVDGFNLYHSIEALLKARPGVRVKWLDLLSLCRAKIDLIAPDAILSEVRYFTARANHLHQKNPGKLTRQNAYIRALTASDVTVIEGFFQQKQVFDFDNMKYVRAYEEKETDVAIASNLFELGARAQADIVVLITADTDLRPAIVTFKGLYPDKRVVLAFPYARRNDVLAGVSDSHLSLIDDDYLNHQFPPAVRLPSGKHVHKPEEW